MLSILVQVCRSALASNSSAVVAAAAAIDSFVLVIAAGHHPLDHLSPDARQICIDIAHGVSSCQGRG